MEKEIDNILTTNNFKKVITMEEKSSIQGKIYVAHTKPNTFVRVNASLLCVEVKSGEHPIRHVVGASKDEQRFTSRRATVVMKFDGENFIYGIAVCSESDKFDKEVGKALALQRMENNFACKHVSQLTNFFSAYEKEKSMALTDHKKAVIFLQRLTDKLERSMVSGKYERLIENHRIAHGELSPRSEREAKKLTQEERIARKQIKQLSKVKEVINVQAEGVGSAINA